MSEDRSQTRLPVVAGYFYPFERSSLLESIKSCFEDEKIGPGISFPDGLKKADGKSSRIRSFVVPHAGYEYSGPVAAHSYYKASDFFSDERKVTVILLGPNHYGLGSGVALSPDSAWVTPLGRVRVNQEICEELADASDIIDSDSSSHSREHSIEVQVPFLQATAGKQDSFDFVPICMMLQDRITSEDVSDAISKVINSSEHSEDNFLILASSDLTHYEPQKRANEKDQKLLEKICELDVNGFYTVLERDNVTACGYGPIATAIRVSKEAGSKSGELLKYATSGAATGDNRAVVGYSAVQLL